MELAGKIIRVENTEQISEKFKKRRVVIDYTKNSNYPQVLEFVLIQGNVDVADKLNQGDTVNIHFDLKGREATDKNGKRMIFNTLEAFRIDITKKSLDFVNESTHESVNNYDDSEGLPF